MGNNEAGEVEQKGAVRLRKAERLQLSLLPHCIDDLVSSDHLGVVRAIQTGQKPAEPGPGVDTQAK